MVFFVGDFHQSTVAWSGLTHVVQVVDFIIKVFWPVFLTVCIAGLLLGRMARARREDLHHSRVIHVGAFASMSALAGLVWIRRRWIIARDNSDWPKPWPYPDTMLLEFHNWLDVQLPVDPGFLKLHAEYYRVLGIIHVCTMVALGIVMVFVGIFSPHNLSEKNQRANSLETSVNSNPRN